LDLARKMPTITKFEKFTSLGSYFSMGGVGSTQVNCPLDTAFTDEALETISNYGGAQVAVLPEDTSINDIEASMALWWKLSYLTLNISASGVVEGSPPTPDQPWSYSVQVNYDGAPRPNKLGSPTGGERILDCPNQDIFDYRTVDEQDPVLGISNFTHLVPLSSGDDAVTHLLAEFFTFIDVIPDTTLTARGLWILSTRNKDYTDVVFEGNDPGAPYTELIGSKTLQLTILGYEITFYASFFVVDSNQQLKADTFDIELVDYGEYVAE